MAIDAASHASPLYRPLRFCFALRHYAAVIDVIA